MHALQEAEAHVADSFKTKSVQKETAEEASGQQTTEASTDVPTSDSTLEKSIDKCKANKTPRTACGFASKPAAGSWALPEANQY